MKKFKFKFEKLLNIREYQEREEQFAFARVYQKYLNIKNIIDFSNEKKEEYLISSKKYVENLDINFLVIRDKARTGLSNKVKINKNRLKEQEFFVETEREKLIEATKKRKTLDLLKEKEFNKYMKEVERVENLELDEIGTNAYIKKLPEKE